MYVRSKKVSVLISSSIGHLSTASSVTISRALAPTLAGWLAASWFLVSLAGCTQVGFGQAPSSSTATPASTGSTGTGSDGSSTPTAVASPTPAPAGGSSTSGTPCTVKTTTQNLRILFMVDASGSTATTDPKFVHRVATVQTFLTNYGTKTNLTYSYSYFGGSTLTYNMEQNGNFVANSVAPFGDATELSAALSLFGSGQAPEPDGGFTTNYMEAFSTLDGLVTADEAATTGENYVVIFMSDGQPKDLGGNGTSQISGITTLVNKLVQDAGSGRLTLSSVFFGDSSDTQSVQNLTTMAQLGGGQFVNTNQTDDVSIDTLITVPGSCN